MSVPINIAIGVVGATDYVLVVLRKTTNPAAEFARQSFGPAPSSIVTSFIGDPVPYFMDVRLSPDGVSLGTLISTYTIDAAASQIISEKRFYTVDGPLATDPDDGDFSITDPYLYLKNVSGLFIEAFRFLEPLTEYEKIDDPVGLTASINMLNGHIFSSGEKITVDITYKGELPVTIQTAIFADVQTITTATTLDATYYNNRIRLAGIAASLPVTLQTLATVPDGTQFYFTDGDGMQPQARIITQGTDKIFWAGINGSDSEMTEIWVGKGQYVWLEKSNGNYEVIGISDAVGQVGEVVTDLFNARPNTLIADGQVGQVALDGDQYPALWWYIMNMLPASYVIVDNNVNNTAYVHPANAVGQFVRHGTLKQFRTPNLQGISLKGLNNFSTYGTADATRPVNYPGGFQDQAALPHFHFTTVNASGAYAALTAGNSIHVQNDSNGDYKYQLSGRSQEPTIGKTSTVNTGGENTVKNAGVVYLIRS